MSRIFTYSLFIIIGAAGLAALLYISYIFINIFLKLDANIQATIFVIIAGTFGALFTFWKERSRSIKEAHRDKKVEYYSIFFQIIFNVIKEIKKSNDSKNYLNSKEFQNSMLEVMKGVLFYGSPEVVLALSKWKSQPKDDKSAKDTLSSIGDVLLAMRKDIGLSNFGLTNISIHQVYVTEDLQSVSEGQKK